jgi:hypothetical protein
MSFRRAASVTLAIAASAVALFPRVADPHETVNTTVLFDREIVKILNSHCVMCHVDGGPSFPLETYEQTWLERRRISAEVIARHMPPWPALSGYGRFKNENVVTLRESQFIVSWMEGLGPRNSGNVFTNTSDPNAPKPQPVRATLDFTTWRLGKPDVVKDVPASGTIDLGLTSDQRLRAFEYKPADRKSVHAAVFTIKETGQWIASWTPWYGFVELPRGMSYRLPAGAHLVASIQGSSGGEVGLFFDSTPRGQTVSDLVVEARGSERLHGETTLGEDTTLLALCPDVIRGIASIEVSARMPDGGTQMLLFAKDFQPEWPTPFVFAEPVKLRRGSVIAITAYGSATALKTIISAVSSGPTPRPSTSSGPRTRKGATAK